MFGSSQKWRRNIDRIDREMNHLFKVNFAAKISKALQEGFEGLVVGIFSSCDSPGEISFIIRCIFSL